MGFAPERASTTAPASSAMATASNEERIVGSAPMIRLQEEGALAQSAAGACSSRPRPPSADPTRFASPCRSGNHRRCGLQHQNAVAEVHHFVEIEGDEETPRPLSRSATSCLWTNSIAPTSRPRVGCTARRASGSRCSSRAMISFCWFPPESAPLECPGWEREHRTLASAVRSVSGCGGSRSCRPS